MNFAHIVGARPNFMKAAPVVEALAKHPGCRQTLIHTGQHYDANMSEVFFQQLGLPRPDVNLEVGSSSHAAQTAQVMVRVEELFMKQRPDWALVYGDVNSTVAAAIVCAKLGIPVAHVEAGLRSFDRSMPEEINRLLTDQLADLLFTPSEDGDANLLREGVAPERIYRVGNVMIDTLVKLRPQAEARWPQVCATLTTQTDALGWQSSRYALVTLHRPSNVDDPEQLARIMASLYRIAESVPVVFPVHPRTRQRLSSMDLDLTKPPEEEAAGPNSRPSSRTKTPPLHLIDPAGYLDFMALQSHAALVITDSGGIQEETTFLGVPCLTMRENTERPVTITMGTNTLVGHDMDLLLAEAGAILRGGGKQGSIPPLWDGKAGERIAGVLMLAGRKEPCP